jgi:uncharacterized protein (TIGR03435 family)
MKLISLVAMMAGAAGAASLTFEVASVKPSPEGRNGVRGACHGIDSKYNPDELASAPPLGRCVITDGRLSHLIFIAYRLQAISRIQGAADWVIAGTDRYTVEAKAEEPAKTTEAQLLEMLQSLLAERFKLKFHWETAEKPGFRLVVVKNGPKLKGAGGEEIAASVLGSFKVPPGQPANITFRKYSMALLADWLSTPAQAPIVDQTELSGEYDFKLSWDETNGPALTTALQQQLGLKLESQKVPMQYFVIESAEMPDAD